MIIVHPGGGGTVGVHPCGRPWLEGGGWTQGVGENSFALPGALKLPYLYSRYEGILSFVGGWRESLPASREMGALAPIYYRIDGDRLLPIQSQDMGE